MNDIICAIAKTVNNNSNAIAMAPIILFLWRIFSGLKSVLSGMSIAFNSNIKVTKIRFKSYFLMTYKKSSCFFLLNKSLILISNTQYLFSFQHNKPKQTSMLKLLIKNHEKTRLHLHLTLKTQAHPWDVLSEKGKEKAQRTEQSAIITDNSTKHQSKKMLYFKEDSTHQLSEILVTQQKTFDDNKEPINQQKVSAQGFYPCPFCTCWFSTKKTLKYHIKHWCAH